MGLLFSTSNSRPVHRTWDLRLFRFSVFLLVFLCSYSLSFNPPDLQQPQVLINQTHAGRVLTMQMSPELHAIPQSPNTIASTNSMPRRKGPPAALRLDNPVHPPQIALPLRTNSASTSAASSAVSELDLFPFRSSTSRPQSLRNMKRLSLTLPLDDASVNSLSTVPSTESQKTSITTPDVSSAKLRPRRQSVASLFTTSINPILHRKDEDGSPTVPYVDGPIQIIPGIWLGSEDNARDWKGLIERGIKTILNVAKEVTSPFDSAAAQPLRPFASTPNLGKKSPESHRQANSTFYPAHLASGRPGMHYLKLEWSHGEIDLVRKGFPAAMAFVDAALEREEGVLIQ